MSIETLVYLSLSLSLSLNYSFLLPKTSQPDQTFALVLVTASTKIRIVGFFFGHSTPKKHQSGEAEEGLFFKKLSDLFSYRFVPVLTYLRASEFCCRGLR
jgi:hypothetical protein